MKAIIKKYIGKKGWADIFCVGDLACEKGGSISHGIFEKMKSEQVIQEIDGAKIIEDHFRHEHLMKDVKDCEYWIIKLKETNTTDEKTKILLDYFGWEKSQFKTMALTIEDFIKRVDQYMTGK